MLEKAKDLADQINLDDIKEWVNHTKESRGRAKSLYPKFERQWDCIKSFYEFIMKSDDNEIKEDIKDIIYQGKIYRVHKFKKDKEQMAGVVESKYHQSWSKSPYFSSNFYWIYDGIEYLLIEATVPKNRYAIDLNEIFSLFGRKIGTPVIENEQEVVYPIRHEEIDEISLVIFKNGEIIKKKVFYTKYIDMSNR